MTAPVIYTWSGEAMVPHAAFAKLCARQFVCGENYRLVQHEDRSEASHKQFFAELYDKWLTLPEDLQAEYPSVAHLRAKALIRSGHFTQRDFVCASNAEALKLASWLRADDDYSIVEVRGRVLRKSVASSQAYNEMGKHSFQKSKQDVLDYVDRLLGVEPTPLADHQGGLQRMGRGRG